MSTISQAVATQDNATKTGRYLTFRLGKESYGIPVLNVREIIRLCPITPVPKMPTHIKGVINLRGTVIAVLDLRAKFQLSQAEYNDRACIIVVQLNSAAGVKTLMGAIVDAVEEVVHLNEGAIEPAPDFGGSPDHQYILGVTTTQEGVKTLLDIEKIFLDDASATRSLPDAAPRLADSTLSLTDTAPSRSTQSGK
jgi:purine-binding chemotaxis protein CheW